MIILGLVWGFVPKKRKITLADFWRRKKALFKTDLQMTRTRIGYTRTYIYEISQCRIYLTTHSTTNICIFTSIFTLLYCITFLTSQLYWLIVIQLFPDPHICIASISEQKLGESFRVNIAWWANHMGISLHSRSKNHRQLYVRHHLGNPLFMHSDSLHSDFVASRRIPEGTPLYAKPTNALVKLL